MISYVQDLSQELRDRRSELQSYTREKTDRILQLNNEISRLTKVLEHAQNHNKVLQMKMEHNAQNSTLNTVEYGQVEPIMKNYAFEIE